MTTDLYKTKSEQLWDFCKAKKVFSKREAMDWGSNHFFISAERRIREFVKKGKLRKLSQDECLLRNLKGRMAWYETV